MYFRNAAFRRSNIDCARGRKLPPVHDPETPSAAWDDRILQRRVAFDRNRCVSNRCQNAKTPAGAGALLAAATTANGHGR